MLSNVVRVVSAAALAVVLSSGLAACSKGKSEKQSLAPATLVGLDQRTVMSASGTERQEADATLVKSAILGQSFLYGADLQFSSMRDEDMATGLQSIAIGHYLAYFKIVGDKLQLLNDQTPNFESDVTHPDRLLHEFQILKQDAETITVRIERPSPTLVTVLGNSKSAKERSGWVRSVEYVRDGNYLLMETTIEAADGSVAQFMESVFPRATLVPEGYKAILNDAGREPLADRYRFLDGGKVFLNLEEGRVETAVANRFHIKDGKVIEWYVAGNPPEEFMADLRTGIEGWNRYFQAMHGRDGVKFMGRLPEGVKIGDPRYNVVLWDNVADAGAAYESQAADPLTGIQSHSLIYIPHAWINIGKEYWNNGSFSDAAEQAAQRMAKALRGRSHLGSKLRVGCLQDAAEHVSIEARQDPHSFARELLKGVVFHEMGHALGLAHNFRGSLSFDPDDSHAMFTTSIMDYNQYNAERQAFESVESEKGPLLEYDRQILSVLYNEGKDVKEADPVLVACNDDEADGTAGGVDPLCVRYDIGKDPTQQLLRSIALLSEEDAKSGRTQSLSRALNAMGEELLVDPAAIVDEAAATKAMSKLAAQSKGLVSFYTSVSANSLRYMTMANIKSLYIHKEEILPEGYDGSAMRNRAWQGVEFSAGLEQLPEVSVKAIAALGERTRAFLLATPAMQSLAEGEREEKLKQFLKPMGAVLGYAEGKDALGVLARVRLRVLGSLVRVADAPFHMEVDEAGNRLDLEAKALEVLERNLTTQVAGKKRLVAERTAVITALKTFADTKEGEEAIERVKAALEKEKAAATDAREREEVRGLIAALK